MLNRQYHDHVLLHGNVHGHHVSYGFDADDVNEPIRLVNGCSFNASISLSENVLLLGVNVFSALTFLVTII